MLAGKSMKLKPKFGIVVLMDALGARTMSIQSSAEYLNSIALLKREIQDLHQITLEEEGNPSVSDMFAKLKPRFFGDSILMTYQVRDGELLIEYLDKLVYTLNCFVPTAMELGVLFRGALSIGYYLEKQDVALGPAVTDAANWYEKADFIGIIATPSAAHHVKAAYAEEYSPDALDCPLAGFLVTYNVPLSDGGTLGTYALNWPDAMSAIHCKTYEQTPLPWFYDRVKEFSVPPGTETKYVNTEAFIRNSLALASAKKKGPPASG